MVARPIRVLLLSDTHLGYDYPIRPRIRRRRRGPDFFENTCRALRPALQDEVDLVVHAGDVFHRSRVHPEIMRIAFLLLREAASHVPVVVVPGNHERSRIGLPLLSRHPGLTIVDRPETHCFDVRGTQVAVSAFPFARDVRGEAFRRLVEATGWRDVDADVRLLAIHQAVEGAQVGIQDYTFRRGKDVVPTRAIPSGFAAVLAGHIHRAQTLTRDLAGRRLPTPVVYPGSIERTAFAERAEAKRFLVLDFAAEANRGRLVRVDGRLLPTRPMRVVRLEVEGLDPDALALAIESTLERLPEDAVVRIDPVGEPQPQATFLLQTPMLRTMAPETMNVESTWGRKPRKPRSGRRA